MQVIKRHWLPPLLVTIGAFLVEIAILAAIFYLFKTQQLAISTYVTLGVLLVLIFMISAVWVYVYNLSFLGVSADKIIFVRWLTLFSSQEAVCEWRDIEDITIQQGNILAQLFGYGSLTIETAGTKPNLTMPNVPAVESLRDYLLSKAESSSQRVTNVNS
jgi:membrane protein YdbS with pleckstrin-like domain